ncbi:MAG: class I SAM-dependent methyltransferase [Verrucomicrobiaceae bacterium]|nr:MAG: class I SAM-dependent methyltransferase [Verrucomicrobiaceae bacterium]
MSATDQPATPQLTSFNQDHATVYDERFAKLAPFRDALHLLSAAALQPLPENARVLCVGAGTGAELLALAARFPGWHFTAVEPSGPMLDRCRSKAEAAGVSDRCDFHEGYLETLPEGEPYHAATSFLVSQFVMDVDKRRDFFRGIRNRLVSGGHLLTADLSADRTEETYHELFETWLRLMEHTGLPPEAIAQLRTVYGRDVAITPPDELEALIVSAGFATPGPFLQTGLIRAWSTTRI